VPLVLAAGFFNVPWIFFIMYNCVCAALLIVDAALTPSRAFFEVARVDGGMLYYGAANAISIDVTNYSRRALFVELLDGLPDTHFEALSKNPARVVPSRRRERFEYSVLAKKRGNFTFNNVYLKIKGVLGFCHKFYTYPAPALLKVCPDVRDLSKYRIFALRNRVLAERGRRVGVKGAGTEFESLREYVEGDDFRKINWMNTAREDKLIINQYDAEKNQPVFVLLDTGRTMTHTVKDGYKKLDYAVNAAIILCDIVNKKGDNSGVMAFNEAVRAIVTPGKDESHRRRVMDALYAVEGSSGASDYEAAFLELVAKQKRRSIVFLFTDFETIEEAAQIIENIDIITKKHVLIIVYIKNESASRMANAETANTSGKASHKITKDIFVKAAAIDFLRERENAARQLAARGIMCVETSAENFALNVVNSYIRAKNRNML
jgi:uncharacterized protein (DUF58 family)